MKLFQAETELSRLKQKASSLIELARLAHNSDNSELASHLSSVDEVLTDIRNLEHKIQKVKVETPLSEGIVSMSIFEAEIFVSELETRATLNLRLCQEFLSKGESSISSNLREEYLKHLNVKASVEGQLYIAKISTEV